MNIFSSCYCPPIPWFTGVLRHESVIIEQWSYYRKQQFSSRMHVKLANRVYPLTIPVERRGARMPLKEKRISYSEDWQRQHWHSLEAAYRNSPYFEFYADPLKESLFRSHKFLLDLHVECLELLLKWVGWEGFWTLSSEYLPSEMYTKDYREEFDASLRTFPAWFKPVVYPQVFERFDEGLSIIDLLCNEGPAARTILLDSYQDHSIDSD